MYTACPKKKTFFPSNLQFSSAFEKSIGIMKAEVYRIISKSVIRIDAM